MLALRDELTSRPFDDPGRWWPDQPGVVGGRDQVAGGTWCATDVPTGVTALVLNRPERRVAAEGAPSRGVLPLLGARRGREWVEEVDLEGMASFTLVLVTPDALTCWDFDGADLTVTDQPPGTHLFTSGGAEDGRAERHLSSFRSAKVGQWVDLVRARPPADDPAALVVRHEVEERVFATVFGQLIVAAPGRLDLSFSRRPWEGDWAQMP